MTHTPGPWHENTRETGDITPRVEDSSGKSVALAIGDGTRSHAEGIANAKLMATAPALLDVALDAAIEISRTIERGADEEELMATLKKLNAAIAKAKGQ